MSNSNLSNDDDVVCYLLLSHTHWLWPALCVHSVVSGRFVPLPVNKMHWSSSPIFWSQPLYSEHVLVCCLGPSSCNIGKSGVVVHFTQKSLVHSRSSITPWFTVLIEKDLYDCSSLTTFSWLTHTFWRRSDHRKPYISKGHFTLNLVFDIGFLSKTRVVTSM